MYAKLNAAFSIGGAPLLVATIEQLTGLHIDHFASVNFPGLQGMVNALGGIDVCIGTTRHDTNSGDFLTAGEHHINGVQALALVRDRESFPNEDLERIKDQEYFLSVMLQKVLSAGTLVNPLEAHRVPQPGDQIAHGRLRAFVGRHAQTRVAVQPPRPQPRHVSHRPDPELQLLGDQQRLRQPTARQRRTRPRRDGRAVRHFRERQHDVSVRLRISAPGVPA